MILNSTVKLKSAMNGKVITMSEGEHKSKPGYLIVTNYTGSTKQKFVICTSKELFTIRAMLNNTAIDVEGKSTSVYAPVLCYKLHEEKNQLWKLKKEGQIGYYIENSKSGQVLEIEGGIDADGMRIVQNPYYKNLNQLWIIEQA